MTVASKHFSNEKYMMLKLLLPNYLTGGWTDKGKMVQETWLLSQYFINRNVVGCSVDC